ncbi:MAG: T9SS type A sorting domain-containing protein [candidate division Zixibacteria bacterium]|nr:T9SS type A sorting domain-containing protein [candidate division Zixibacteria bacterium]
MVRLVNGLFTLVMGLALSGLVGKPAHAALYWMDGESAAAPKPASASSIAYHSGSEVLSTAVLRMEDVFTAVGRPFSMPVRLERGENVPSNTMVNATGVQFDLYVSLHSSGPQTGIGTLPVVATFDDIEIDAALADHFTLDYEVMSDYYIPEHPIYNIRVLIYPRLDDPDDNDSASAVFPIDEDGVVVAHIKFLGGTGWGGVVGTPTLGGGNVTASGVIITGEEEDETLGTAYINGQITFVLPGDVNISPYLGVGDGVLDIRDVVRMIRFVLGNLEGQGAAILAAADVNNDGEINVTDVVGIVNIILGRDIYYGPNQKVTSNPVTVNLGAITVRGDGQAVVPVLLNGADMVAGAHATFTFDPKAMSVGTPFVEGNPEHLILDSEVVDGKMQVIVVSMSKDQGIGTGVTPTLLIPVTLLGDSNAIIRLTDLTLSNEYSRAMPISFGATEQSFTKGTRLPTRFALKNGSPNPFNPSTAISYEVPQQAHITLTVYNLLGQEVIRLVDQVQTPGRYQVTWNAVNAAGRSLSTGVYLYRLTSSTGFSDTKRITLLK